MKVHTTFCPFCYLPCHAGSDCGCGALAINSVFWHDPEVALMRSSSEVSLSAVVKMKLQSRQPLNQVYVRPMIYQWLLI